MKKILFILTISVVSILAKPCMTDIYFGNGVWNTPTQASKSAKELRKFMQINYNARLDRNKEGETYQFMPPTYNPTRGTIEDLLETFWQLKESGQISEGYFTAKWNLLTADRGPDELRKSMNRIAATNTVDVNQMYQRYKVSSLDKKNNILLVAHSQGNLFGNKIYTILTDQQKQKFRMVSVATPANSVAGGGSYVTATLDYVIAGIPDHLSANVAGVGHTFVGTYLGSSFEARTKIALHVKSAYDNLMQTTSCVEGSYSYYVWISYMCPTYSAQELVVDIYGRPTDAPYPYKKQLVTSDSRIRMPYEIIDGNEICSIYGDDRLSIWPEYDKGGCYAYSLDDNHPAGTHTLDQIANKTYDNRSGCTRYQMSSEIADSLSSMLP